MKLLDEKETCMNDLLNAHVRFPTEPIFFYFLVWNIELVNHEKTRYTNN